MRLPMFISVTFLDRVTCLPHNVTKETFSPLEVKETVTADMQPVVIIYHVPDILQTLDARHYLVSQELFSSVG